MEYQGDRQDLLFNGQWVVVMELKVMVVAYQNSECRSYKVMLKAGSREYGRSGVMGLVGAYNVGARTWPQLIGCALAQEPGVLNSGLGLQTMEGDKYAETGR